jgi:hypothetical protein
MSVDRAELTRRADPRGGPRATRHYRLVILIRNVTNDWMNR